MKNPYSPYHQYGHLPHNTSSTPPKLDNEEDPKDTDIKAQHTPADKNTGCGKRNTRRNQPHS